MNDDKIEQLCYLIAVLLKEPTALTHQQALLAEALYNELEDMV